MTIHAFDDALQLVAQGGGQCQGAMALTVYFHATAPQLRETATGYLLGQARGQAFCNGCIDQAGQLWNAAGHLLATTHQLVYYKE